MRYFPVWTLIVPCLMAPVSAQVDPNYRLFIPDKVLVDGDPGQVRVMLTNEAATWGWSYGVCHDETQLELLALTQGNTTARAVMGGPVAFYSANVYPDGFTVGVVVDFDINLPAGVDRELDIATYQALVPPPAQVPLIFCDTLGVPPVELSVVDQTGSAVSPLVTDGIVEIRTRAFVRADCNGDTSLDIADAIYLGAHLFGGGEIPKCGAACDANSDLTLDIADMIYSVSFLFSGGPLPAAPFPVCGPEPVPSLECMTPPPCP